MRVIRILLCLTLLSCLVPDAFAQNGAFTLSSTDVTGGAFKPDQIFNSFGCSGGPGSWEPPWRSPC